MKGNYSKLLFVNVKAILSGNYKMLSTLQKDKKDISNSALLGNMI
jgi:hypothetical protein